MNKLNKLRKEVLRISYKAGACHIGSSLSCLNIIYNLYFKTMKKDDLFVFSKASGVSALYVVLAEKGIILREKLVYYLKNYPLPDSKVPGVIFTGGSLGHGLPFAVGMALALKKQKKKGRVFCLVGDGDMQEGTTWESLLFRRQHRLDNLKIIYDANGLQACGEVEKILTLPLKFLEENGVNVFYTIKGAGIRFLEDKVESHYLNLTKQTYEEAIKQIN